MAERTSALTAGGHKSICVYDGQLNLLGRLESWVSLVWPERYNVYSGVQGAQLELHASTDLQALCRPDRYLGLTGSDRIMRICSAQTDRSEHKLVDLGQGRRLHPGRAHQHPDPERLCGGKHPAQPCVRCGCMAGAGAGRACRSLPTPTPAR